MAARDGLKDRTRNVNREYPVCHYYLWDPHGVMVNHRTEYLDIGQQLLLCSVYPRLRRSAPKATAT